MCQSFKFSIKIIMNKQIEWYFFNLSSPTNIDWKKKHFTIRKSADTILINIETLFHLNKINYYYLENLCNNTMRKIAKKEFELLKNNYFITFQINCSNDNKFIKQGILLINCQYNYKQTINNNLENLFNSSVNINNIKSRLFHYSKYLFINLKKLNENTKFNLIKESIFNNMNSQNMNNDIINFNDLELMLGDLLEKIYPYFYLCKFNYKIYNNNFFFKKNLT